MKKLLLIFTVFLLVFGIAGGLQALPIITGDGPVVTAPLWIGTEANVSNYDYTTVNDIIENWNDAYVPPASAFDTLTDNSYDYASGPNMTWTGNYQYLTVKYATNIDLFYVDGLTSYDWAGSRIGARQGFSHARLWNHTSVPEPAGMFLLGTGLIGLAALGRRKFRK